MILLQYLNAKSLHKAVKTTAAISKAAHLHQMLGVVIIVAHASEIVRVVSHITIWHLGIALVLFGLWLITQKSGTELA